MGMATIKAVGEQLQAIMTHGDMIADLKGIGKMQRFIISLLTDKKNSYILLVDEENINHRSFSISDDDGNDYVSISEAQFESLLKRKIIFESKRLHRTIDIVHVQYKLNPYTV